ncbi:MAG: energy transducer TonB [Chitinophagales bacterium]|nr:energy transducer TonB [Chitinophagaceae bacterium]MCB9063628.1 energy transducer TonB [Chitinophagales bacterium]
MDIAQQQPINYKAAAWTVLIHALLLLLFFFIHYNVPEVEPVDEMGMEVNIGTSADGYGTNQPLAVGSPAPDYAATTSLNDASSSDLPSDILESTEPDAPAINATNRNNNTGANNRVNSNANTTSERSANNNTPRREARYVYGGSTGDGGNNANTNADGGSEGNTTGTGDRGVPGGTPGADNYEGTPGNGGGISHTLRGRNIVAFPEKDAEFRESGSVTIRVTVNRLGNIVDKRIVSASNSQLRAIALEKVSKIRFNKSNDAPEEQFGNITFVFKTRS